MSEETDKKTDEAQSPLVLAQVAAMPNGRLAVSVADIVDDKTAFCIEAAQTFLQHAGQQYVLSKTQKQSEILVAPPGMRVQ